MNVSGAKRDRTADLLNAIQTLSQLSYSPKMIYLSNNKQATNFEAKVKIY